MKDHWRYITRVGHSRRLQTPLGCVFTSHELIESNNRPSLVAVNQVVTLTRIMTNMKASCNLVNLLQVSSRLCAVMWTRVHATGRRPCSRRRCWFIGCCCCCCCWDDAAVCDHYTVLLGGSFCAAPQWVPACLPIISRRDVDMTGSDRRTVGETRAKSNRQRVDDEK